MTQRLVEIAACAASAGHGEKEPVYAAACVELGVSRASLMRWLKEVAVRPARKQRSDAGDVALSHQEALVISAALMESHRKNNKQLFAVNQAVEVLRANGLVRAERIDEATGELRALSDSAISRALRVHGLHPEQLLRPAPAVQLRSLHPNHVWSVDASLCVLYYLSNGDMGLQVMERRHFYKNKPAALARVVSERVWRYAFTDHNSGAVFVFYVLGSESGPNLAEAFITAIHRRENDPFHGVPFILMMDMGSANTSGLFKNLARRLQIKLIAHAPENARATGQVEKAHDLIERSFESGLKFQPVGNLDELNALACKWSIWFNSTKVHTRHGKTRFAQWMTITADQLRIAPGAELCRQLLTHAPESRKVQDGLTIDFNGKPYDVRDVPRVMVGERLMVTYNPYQTDSATIIDTDADGNELLITVPRVREGDDGFREDANVIGEDYRHHRLTRADHSRKAVELLAMDAATPAEAKAKRKAKALPFGGRLDPFKPIDDTPLPAYLPRAGTELAPATRVHAAAVELGLFEVATHLSNRGVEMTPAKNALIAAWYPGGTVPEADLEDLQHRLTVRAGLRMVAGGAPE